MSATILLALLAVVVAVGSSAGFAVVYVSARLLRIGV